MSAGAGLTPPIAPQLARPRAALPEGEGFVYEPKLDGFRAIVFVDGADVVVQSRGGRPLGRYFPEITLPGGRYVLDGEIVVRGADGREDFGALQQRIHPAESRVRELAARTPAHFVAFDLLAWEGRSLLARPFAERRRLLERELGGRVELTPVSADRACAREWLSSTEGVIAKERGAPYRPGERRGMYKVKRRRSADCVVLGWRPGRAAGTVGSLVIGLYERDGALRPVGHVAGFSARQKRELRELLAPLETGARGTGVPSRWTSGRALEWVELRPELVAEVAYDHVSGGRIRHGARLLRWRPDRDPASCGVEQLEDRPPGRASG